MRVRELAPLWGLDLFPNHVTALVIAAPVVRVAVVLVAPGGGCRAFGFFCVILRVFTIEPIKYLTLRFCAQTPFSERSPELSSDCIWNQESSENPCLKISTAERLSGDNVLTMESDPRCEPFYFTAHYPDSVRRGPATQPTDFHLIYCVCASCLASSLVSDSIQISTRCYSLDLLILLLDSVTRWFIDALFSAQDLGSELALNSVIKLPTNPQSNRTVCFLLSAFSDSSISFRNHNSIRAETRKHWSLYPDTDYCPLPFWGW